MPAPADLVIYRVRNDGPQDLASAVIYRPQPPDRITYPLAVTGDTVGWAANEIALGPLAVTREAKFTFCCGSAVELPEFRVRIECKSGPDTWTLSRVLPPPRGEPISAEERGHREQILSSALVEIERNIEAVQSQHWYSVSLSDDALDDAHVLLRRHAPDWIGPIRDALFGLTDFAVWAQRSRGSYTGDELEHRRNELLARLSSAHTEIERMSAALESPQGSGRSWRS